MSIIEFKKIRRLTNDPPCAVNNDRLIKTASNWWENDTYTHKLRWTLLKLFGLPILPIPCIETVKSVYGEKSNDILELLEQLKIPLNENSRIFEAGCNLGRNLISIQDKYKSFIFGIDISQKAIVKAKRTFKKGWFWCDNALTFDFGQFEDNYFDVVFTRWHLIHVPRCPEKTRYINELKRIGKITILCEPVGRNNCEYYHKGNYCLSWDNWKDYGFKEIDSGSESLHSGDTKIYIHKKEF